MGLLWGMQSTTSSNLPEDYTLTVDRLHVEEADEINDADYITILWLMHHDQSGKRKALTYRALKEDAAFMAHWSRCHEELILMAHEHKKTGHCEMLEGTADAVPR